MSPPPPPGAWHLLSALKKDTRRVGKAPDSTPKTSKRIALEVITRLAEAGIIIKIVFYWSPLLRIISRLVGDVIGGPRRHGSDARSVAVAVGVYSWWPSQVSATVAERHDTNGVTSLTALSGRNIRAHFAQLSLFPLSTPLTSFNIKTQQHARMHKPLQSLHLAHLMKNGRWCSSLNV